MSHTLSDMEVANLTGESLKKLQDAERAINGSGGGDKNEEIYLLALKKQGR